MITLLGSETSIWQTLGPVILGIIVTMVMFWAGIIRKMATREEVCNMIENHSPYAKDRQYIMERLAMSKEIQAELSTALKHNSDVMNELRIQIATLAKTLEALEKRMEE